MISFVVVMLLNICLPKTFMLSVERPVIFHTSNSHFSTAVDQVCERLLRKIITYEDHREYFKKKFGGTK